MRWQIVSEFWRDAVLGLLILLAVAADTILMRRLRTSGSSAHVRRPEPAIGSARRRSSA